MSIGLEWEVWGQTSWTLKNSAAEDALNAVVYDGNRFVAVGEAGALVTSVDGEMWSSASVGTIGGSMRGLLFTGTHYVACGQNDQLFGAVLTSADATVWTPAVVASSSGSILTGLATNGTGHYVACGAAGRLYRTRNTASWPSYVTLPGEPLLQAVVYGRGWFVAVGESGTLARSRDGEQWTVIPTGTNEFLSGITYGNGRWVAVGSGGTILTSMDLTTWSPRPSVTTKYLFSVSYEAGHYVATGADGMILTSLDGQAWTVRPTGLSQERLAAVVEGGDLVVVVGELAFTTGFAVVLTAVAERPPGFRWSAAAAHALEAEGSVDLTLTRVGSSDGEAQVEYLLQSGTAEIGSDLPDSSGVVTFASGQTSRAITLPLTQDELFEGEENFLVELRTLTPGWAALRPGTVFVNVRDAQDSDDDGLPDRWEQTHFQNLAATAAADPDGDGNSNLTEYTDGTLPTDMTSAHYFLNLSSTGEGSLTTIPPTAKFPRDSNVTVIATPAEGWVVQSWTGAGTGDGLNRSVAMAGDQSLAATFVLSLGGALEAPTLALTTSGTGQPWFGQLDFSKDGVDAAKSGPTPPNTATSLHTTVVGPAALSFWWRASCRANSDYLKFFLDGEEYDSRTGAANWDIVTLELAPGEHTLTWTYSRGPQGPIGQDAGWLDLVTVTVGGYVSWLPQHFTPAEIAQPGLTGPTADPDLDGIPNLVEFALRTSPRDGSAAAPGLPRVEIVTSPAGARRALLFSRPAELASQIVYQGEWSSDLVTWSVFGAEEILTSESGIDSVRIVDPQVPADAPRRLYRLRVTTSVPQ
ncbi:MAG: Calx-beta domain-containing protein [Verrucomicrobiales bacterium]